MKNIIYKSLLLCTILLLQSCGKTTHPDLKLFQLKGKVKSLSYGIVSDNKDYYWGGALDIYYGDFYDYKFSKEGKWTNPKEMVERNSDGYITKLGNRKLTWDNKGYLTRRLDCSPYEDEPCDGIEYYYKDENVVDSLHECLSGADAEIIHRYRCEDLDEYGNWTYAKVEVVDISRGNMREGEYTVIRNIKYWTEEELNPVKKKTSSKDPTTSFNETIKNRNLIFRFPFNGDCYKSLLFFPITDTKGHAYLLDFDSNMKSCSGWHSYRFIYTISNNEIFITNGTSLAKNAYGDYNKHEDTVLKIVNNGSGNIELEVMPSGPNCVEYIWSSNIDDFKNRID